MTDANGVVTDEPDGRHENHIDYHSQLFSSLNLNDITIEDIEEVIEKDKSGETTVDKLIGRVLAKSPDVDASIMDSAVAGPSSKGNRGGGSSGSGRSSQPEAKILIQPAQKALRFRYECEGRSAGSIPGANSTQDNKTYPTIQVLNYRGPFAVVVSCVTKDKPYRPHPHKLVGKEGCKRGICTVIMDNDNMISSFQNLGIQCVKRKDIEEALRERSEAKIDPFSTSSPHKTQVGNIDLNSVRLCFQVFLKGQAGKFTEPLPPVVSDPIYDKKSMCDLVICKLSACSASVWGGSEIIVLCEKIVRDDIQVRFYETKDDQVIWEGYGEFQPSDVHKQVAISLKTPKYADLEVAHPVEAYVQLRRPSDNSTSDPRAFQFLPADSDPEGLKRKRQKIAKTSFGLYLAENAGATRPDLRPPNPAARRPTIVDPRPIRQPHRTRIKMEPPDTGYGNEYPAPPYYGTAGIGGSANIVDPASHNIPLGVYDHFIPTTKTFYQLNPVVHQATLAHHQQQQQQARMPEVITIPSYSSSGSSNPMMYSGSNPILSGHSKASGSDVDGHQQHQHQQQQNLSSGSTRLSLGLGSLGSLPLSESTLSIIGSHLSDTLMCLNSNSIEAQLMNSGGEHPGQQQQHLEYIGGAVGSREAVYDGGQVNADGREPSMDSFSGILNQLDQLNEMGAVGGVMDTTSPDKYQS